MGTDSVEGEAETVKSGAVTESVTLVVCVVVPPTPLMVSGYVPAGVVVAAVNVSCDEAGAAADAGEKLAVAPVGSPVTERPTVPE